MCLERKRERERERKERKIDIICVIQSQNYAFYAEGKVKINTVLDVSIFTFPSAKKRK